MIDMENEFKLDQGMLGQFIGGAKTNVDIVFVIDVTGSMTPVIETVKSFALSFHQKVIEGLKKANRSIHQMRVKVIAFRDYYCDGDMSMEESEFFYLPDESEEFRSFIDSMRATGGGDIPESGLEALALAMRSDWVQEGTSKRHVIVLFTDAPAHPLEKQKDGIPGNYPSDMFGSFNELIESWGIGQGRLDSANTKFRMDKNARRLVLFAPEEEPWTEIQEYFEQCIMKPIELDQGGMELDSEIVINTIAKSIK